MDHQADTFLRLACDGTALSARQALSLVQRLPGGFLALLAAAGASASRQNGPSAFTCGIINAKSGRCSEDCAFCAQSRFHATQAAVHPLIGEEALLERADALAHSGARYMGIVTSGARPSPRDFAAICRAAARITREVGIRLCASLGMLEEEEARALKDAGFTSYHHNLESARSYYGRICTTHAYDARLETVKRAKAAGLRTCSGGIFGLGEDWEQRLELATTLRDLDVDSIPVNFLTPIAGTALEGEQGLAAREALAVIAVFRLMHPTRDIIVCGGRSRTLNDWENSLFFAGANAMMIGNYLTTRGNPLERDLEMLRTLGII